MSRREESPNRSSEAVRRVFGWMGVVLLLAIPLVKLLRVLQPGANDLVIGVAPSLLGPAGFLFLLLSSAGWSSRLSLRQLALLVAAASVAIEIVQSLPRPGLLARAHYTYDLQDLVASVVSVAFGYVIATVILRKRRSGREEAQRDVAVGIGSDARERKR